MKKRWTGWLAVAGAGALFFLAGSATPARADDYDHYRGDRYQHDYNRGRSNDNWGFNLWFGSGRDRYGRDHRYRDYDRDRDGRRWDRDRREREHRYRDYDRDRDRDGDRGRW